MDAADTTLAANPHLKQIFGYPPEAREADVAPFAAERFVDDDARMALVNRLVEAGAVTDYLLRMRRMNAAFG